MPHPKIEAARDRQKVKALEARVHILSTALENIVHLPHHRTEEINPMAEEALARSYAIMKGERGMGKALEAATKESVEAINRTFCRVFEEVRNG